MKNKTNYKKIITIASILVVIVCLVAGISTFVKPKDKVPVDKYVTSELIENVNTLEKDQMEELARKTLIIMSDKEVVDSNAIKTETSGIMTVLTYNTSKEARDAYERYSKDESILLCEYDKTVDVQGNEEEVKEENVSFEEPINQTSSITNNNSHQEDDSCDLVEDDDILYYYESIEDMIMDDLKDTSNEKIYDKIISNIGKDDASKVPTIVIIDTGYNGEADYKYNATNGSSDVTDTHGHGSSMVNIIKTQMGDIEYKLAIVKIANDNGYANTSYLVKAFEYIGTINPTVINMSFITTDKAQSDVLLSYVNKFSANGVAVVCSAGNLNDDAINYIPSSFDSAIVVGSCDEKGNKKDFSNFGITVDINIVSDSTSEASAKVSSLYAMAYATNKNIADVLNESKVVFQPNGGEYRETSGSSNEEVNENLWWWCITVYKEASYNTTDTGWFYTDYLKDNPYDNIFYKSQIQVTTPIKVGDVAGNNTSTIDAGTYVAFGHNCYNKVHLYFREDYAAANGIADPKDVPASIAQAAYKNGEFADYWTAHGTSDEPTFVHKSDGWYVALGPGNKSGSGNVLTEKLIYCKKHNNYVVHGTNSGWYNLDQFAEKTPDKPTPTKYTVSYNANGGTPTPSSQTVNAGSSVTLPYISKVGHTFNGWFSPDEVYRGTGGSSYTPPSDITLTARWTPNTYTLTIDPAGGTFVNFSGANVTSSVSKTFTYYTNIPFCIYAKTPGTTNYYSASSLCVSIPWREGYAFAGWKVTSGSGTITSGNTFSDICDSYEYDGKYAGNVTITAQWTKTDFTLTINPNGGTMYNGDNTTTSPFTTGFRHNRKTYIGNLKSNSRYYPDNAPWRTGYTFNGWTFSGGTGGKNTNGDDFYFGTGTSYASSTNSYIFNGNYAGDVTATANWIANQYTVNYYNGTTLLGSSPHTYGIAKNLTSFSALGGKVTNSEYGWTFAGWHLYYPDASVSYGDGVSVNNLTSTNGGTVSLYAVYKRTITFKSGVNGSTTNTITQYWCPYSGNTSYITSITTPSITSIPNWNVGAPGGWRNDTQATALQYSSGFTFTPAANTSPNYYGVYYRYISFKSGVNASVEDTSALQYLNSYNNTVSSITSGTPSSITNWTALGYRDDTSVGSKEYDSNATITPAYNTGNIFYATYSRPLTIIYDKNSPEPFVATGNVANTTSTIYLNSYNTTMSSQVVTLSNNANGFVRTGFKLTKWDIGNLGANYNPNLAYNHSTFKVVAKAIWEHDNSGVGTIKTPSLKVNNPNASGIYYNNGIYFIKGDGKTIVELYGEAILDPMFITRLDKLSLNDGENVLTSNPTYKETYYLEVPKNDVWNLIYNKANIVKYNTHTGILFKTANDPIVVDLLQGKMSFTQQFTIVGDVAKEQYIGARACCMYEPCTDASHTIHMYGNSIKLQGDASKPYAYIIDEKSNKVSMDAYNTKWTNQNKVTIEFKDDISGVKYYKLTKNGTTVTEVTNTSYKTVGNITLNLEEGALTYTLIVRDNVGNEITYTFNPHVDKTTPTLKDLVDYKVMGDGNISQSKNDVYAGSTNTWPTTNKDVTWEYDWQNLKYLKFQATDDRSGFRKVIVHHYGKDSTYTTAWKTPSTLANVSGDVLNAELSYIIESFNGNEWFQEGKNYLLIELEDLAGNKVQVKLVVRRDSKKPSITNAIVKPITLDNFTKSEIESIFASGDMSRFKTNVSFNVSDNLGTNDTSGIKKLEIVVYDAKTNAELKRYDVTNQLSISEYTLETNQGSSKFNPMVRPLIGSVNVNIDTIKEFPGYNELIIECEATDYVGNKKVVTAQIKDAPEPNLVPNYAIKTIMYATKEKAYNVISADGETNMPYFKTGEVGFIEVWTIGYVDTLELDFSDGNIGQEMNQAIANGQISSKYILGVHNGLPNQVRYVTNMSRFKVNTNYDDYNGVPYAAHIGYSFDEVNNSLGSMGVDGWSEKGTMIRIPSNHELVKKNKLDKYGNQLYKWETHIANVYPIKNGNVGDPSGNYYTIWDESGDDLHFRITHLLFGY